MDKAQDILQEAIQAFTALSGFRANVIHSEIDHMWDAVLEVGAHYDRLRLGVKVKQNLTKSNASVLVSRSHRQNDLPLLIVTEHVSPPVARLLRQYNINYMDAAGNCYLHDGSLFVLIEGRKRKKPVKSEPVRAFQDAGLRLIFLLLLDPDKASSTYRDLARMAGISRGAVGYILNDLIDLGYIVEVGNGRRKLLKRDELIEKWVSGYGETLRPKLDRDRFRFRDADQQRWWRDIPVASTGSLWGGEPAADLLTNYLRPEIFTLYSDAPTSELVQKTKLLPDPEGPIEVLSTFWEEKEIRSFLPSVEPPCVPLLLVYADLIASAKSHNLDTARLLYREKLSK